MQLKYHGTHTPKEMKNGLKKQQVICQQRVKEKSLILKKARRNLKIEAGPSLLSLKNIEEIGIN